MASQPPGGTTRTDLGQTDQAATERTDRRRQAILGRHAETLRKLRESENTIQNNRFLWMVQLQGLLFTSLALVWDRKEAELLILFMCLLGVWSAVGCWVALLYTTVAFRNINSCWRLLNASNTYRGPLLVAFDSNTEQVREWWDWKGLRPWRNLPLAFIVVWLGIAWVNVYTWGRWTPPTSTSSASPTSGTVGGGGTGSAPTPAITNPTTAAPNEALTRPTDRRAAPVTTTKP